MKELLMIATILILAMPSAFARGRSDATVRLSEGPSVQLKTSGMKAASKSDLFPVDAPEMHTLSIPVGTCPSTFEAIEGGLDCDYKAWHRCRIDLPKNAVVTRIRANRSHNPHYAERLNEYEAKAVAVLIQYRGDEMDVKLPSFLVLKAGQESSTTNHFRGPVRMSESNALELQVASSMIYDPYELRDGKCQAAQLDAAQVFHPPLIELIQIEYGIPRLTSHDDG